MYHDFFGLKEPAFSIAVNPRYLFMSDQHREALAHLLYGIQNGGFVMLTGEVGTGKTTIIRCLLEQLPDNTDIAIILNPTANAPELLSTICDELGVSYINDELTVKNLTDSLNEFLLNNHRKGRKTVLLIDEAQLLRVPVLEQIRLLTNLETTTEKLLQIMLVGQPELKKLLARPALRQLSQRITARFHLEALTAAETKAYIHHRLKVAGLPDHQRPFNDAMIKKIHAFSGGIPRLINVLCERLLLGAYAQNQHTIDKNIFAAATREVAGTATQQEEKVAAARTSWHLLLVAIVGLVMTSAWFLLPDDLSVTAAPMGESDAAQASLSAPDVTSLAPSGADTPDIRGAGLSGINGQAEPLLISLATRDLVAAQLVLFDYLNLSAGNPANPCLAAASANYSCEKVRLASWDELKDINRPGLLTLATADKKWVYLMVVGLSEHYLLVRANGAEKIIPWRDLAPLWTGDFSYIWSRPQGFEKSLQLGDKSELVTWVAEQFAVLDQQSAPLTRQFFTEKLKKRVELFQRTQNILPDGVIGVQTLRRLNEVLGIDKPLLALDEQKVPALLEAQALDTQGL
jgi:general secretion pathway protein A